MWADAYEISVMLLSFTAGAGCIYLIYKIGRRVEKKK